MGVSQSVSLNVFHPWRPNTPSSEHHGMDKSQKLSLFGRVARRTAELFYVAEKAGERFIGFGAVRMIRALTHREWVREDLFRIEFMMDEEYFNLILNHLIEKKLVRREQVESLPWPNSYCSLDYDQLYTVVGANIHHILSLRSAELKQLELEICASCELSFQKPLPNPPIPIYCKNKCDTMLKRQKAREFWKLHSTTYAREHIALLHELQKIKNIPNPCGALEVVKDNIVAPSPVVQGRVTYLTFRAKKEGEDFRVKVVKIRRYIVDGDRAIDACFNINQEIACVNNVNEDAENNGDQAIVVGPNVNEDAGLNDGDGIIWEDG